MKSLYLSTGIFFFTLFFIFAFLSQGNIYAGNLEHNSIAAFNPTVDIKTIVIQCDGLSCENCDNKVEKSVSKLKGVKEVKANHRKLIVTVKYDSGIISREELEKAITDLGYKVRKD